MKRFLTLRWLGFAGSLLLIFGAVLVVLWLLRTDDVQAEYQVTRVNLTAAVGATATAPMVETASGSDLLTQSAPTFTVVTIKESTTTPPPSASDGDRSISQSADQPTLNITPTATLVCDQAFAGNPIDITVPDDTQFLPGQAFTKIWRLQNVGACAWTKEYAARFFYGNRLSAPEVVYLDKNVSPGAQIEIAVDMVAPNEPGSYQGNWKLSNANGALFGIGPRSDAPFWVRIIVLHIATPTPTPTDTPTPTATYTPVVTLTSTSVPTAPVQSTGSLVLKAAQNLDLDTGEVDPASGQDMVYKLDGGFHLLAPLSSAILGVSGSQEPNREQCIASVMSPAPIAVESLSPGAYLCYQTGAGLPGWLRFDGLNSQDGSASLVYHTWVNP